VPQKRLNGIFKTKKTFLQIPLGIFIKCRKEKKRKKQQKYSLTKDILSSIYNYFQHLFAHMNLAKKGEKKNQLNYFLWGSWSYLILS